MMPNIIETESEYGAALAKIDEIFDADLDTDEGRELNALCTLVEKYENEHYPIPKPTLIEAIKYRIKQLCSRLQRFCHFAF